MTKILIQANRLDVVIDVFMYKYHHPDAEKKDIAEYCGFTLRQADYYTNACKYLAFLNDDLTPTKLADDIFQNHPAYITERVYEQIITDELIGKIYARMAMINEDVYEYAMSLVQKYHPGYSRAVYERRTTNMIKWCTQIINFQNKKQS